MKKFTYLMIALCFVFSAILMGCSCTKQNVVRVNEVTHSIFYAPLYVAINKGFMEEEKDIRKLEITKENIFILMENILIKKNIITSK